VQCFRRHRAEQRSGEGLVSSVDGMNRYVLVVKIKIYKMYGYIYHM